MGVRYGSGGRAARGKRRAGGRDQRKGTVSGHGFISLHSKIRVRILSRNANDVFDEAFYLRRLSHAWEYRKTVLSGEVSSCRVIFGEADLFPA